MTQPAGILRIASLYTGAGLGGPIDGSTVSAPETLRLAGERIVWSPKATTRKIEVRRILERFLALETPAPGNQDVLEFARAYGPLWLCEQHNFVAYHQPIETMGCNVLPAFPDAPHPASGPSLICLPRSAGTRPMLFSEPVAQWRTLAVNANRLLDAAATMQRGGKVAAETWQGIDGYAAEHPIAQYLSDPRARLAENLNRWLAIADVRFRVGIEDGNIRPQLSANRYTGSVLALIALELVAATVRAAAIARCSACERLFFASPSQPAPGEPIGHATAQAHLLLNLPSGRRSSARRCTGCSRS